MSKCEDCNAFQRRTPTAGICRANPPQVLVFGMEQVKVPGLSRGSQGMRPLTGTGFPEVTNDGWCRGFEAAAAQPALPKFDPAKMKPVGDARHLNGAEVTESVNSTDG